jgi:hypothetical protein
MPCRGPVADFLFFFTIQTFPVYFYTMMTGGTMPKYWAICYISFYDKALDKSRVVKKASY